MRVIFNTMKNKLQKVLSILVIILFPFVLLKLPKEAFANRVLSPIFFLVLSIHLIIILYDSFKKKKIIFLTPYQPIFIYVSPSKTYL